MGKILVIARHGNTFLPEQTPTRAGSKTDLPLVEEKKARSIGKYLSAKHIKPDKFYAAPLKRTMETARLAALEMGLRVRVIPAPDFMEIDYGPDENKTETQVKWRLGKDYAVRNNLPPALSSEEDIMKYGSQIIEAWNTNAILPEGWQADIHKIIESWKTFAQDIREKETVFLSTSNGIIRFAPYVLGIDYHHFCSMHDIKVATGSVSIFTFENGCWHCTAWNVNPSLQYS